MTEATFITNDEGRIIGFTIEGHSGYAMRGLDIVCSAISTMAQGAIYGIMEIAKVKATSHIDEVGVKMSIVVTDRDPANFDKAELLLKTTKAVVEGIQDQYPLNVKVFDVKADVL